MKSLRPLSENKSLSKLASLRARYTDLLESQHEAVQKAFFTGNRSSSGTNNMQSVELVGVTSQPWPNSGAHKR